MKYSLRTATPEDEPALRALIARSIRELGSNDYTPEQIEAALTGAFGLDSSAGRLITAQPVDVSTSCVFRAAC